MAGNNLIKQYFRWLPTQLGMFNKGAFLHQINAIYPDDIFLVSFPKSGNTWLRFIIANLISNKEITFKNIDEFVPDCYTSHQIIDSKKSKRIIKSHNTYFKYYPKSIYIYRDYRDVLVSYYLYQTALNHFNGSIDEFITSKALNTPFNSWKTHLKNALNQQQQHPETILLIAYEELLQNPHNIIKQIIEFCNITPVQAIEDVIKKSEFNHLKAIENKDEGNFKQQTGQSFFRNGKAGNWQKHLTNTTLNTLQQDHELVNLMHQLGYYF